MNASSALNTRVITLLIIYAALGGCRNQTVIPTLKPETCAAVKPTLINVVYLDGYFILTDSDMGQLTGYIAELEEGCIAPD